MISIKLTLNNPPVCIGYKGENVHTEIRFDAEEIFAEYPSATTSMAVRNHEGTLYPVELTRDGNELIWLVTRSDLVCAGSGRYQITFLQGDEVLKTCIGTTIVRNSLDESEAPDPVAGWIEEADKRLAEAEADIDIVLQYIDTAETNANKSEGFAVGQKDGEDVDSDSPYYQNNAKYYNTQAGMAKDAAVQAKEDAETAEGNANQSKTAAAQSAESAQAAQGAAEEAQRKAETAQEKAEDAQGKAEDAQGTAEEAKRTAVQAAETAGGAAENAEESADAAEQSELKAEGYAVGQQSGTDVGSDSPYYQNNAKYYKEQAALSATQAREYRDASQQIADGIESAGAEQVQAVEDKGQEVLDSIPQDYTDLSNEVSDLNRALKETSYLPVPVTWEAGSINSGTGELVDSTRTRNAEYIPTTSVDMYLITDGNNSLMYYDLVDGEYVFKLHVWVTKNNAHAIRKNYQYVRAFINANFVNNPQANANYYKYIAVYRDVKQLQAEQTGLYVANIYSSNGSKISWTQIASLTQLDLSSFTGMVFSGNSGRGEVSKADIIASATASTYTSVSGDVISGNDFAIIYNVDSATITVVEASNTLIDVNKRVLFSVYFGSFVYGDFVDFEIRRRWEATLTRISNLESAVNQDLVLPDYWQTYMETKIADVQEKDEIIGNHGDAFIFCTDQHYNSNTNHSAALINYIKLHSSVNNVVMGGDLMNGSTTSKQAALDMLTGARDHYRTLNPKYLRGNHDNNTEISGRPPELALTDDEVYGILFKPIEDDIVADGQMFYYYDNQAQKIRYICLDTGHPDQNVISDAQITWMQSKITELSAGWSVVVLTHQFFSTPPTKDGNGDKIEAGLDAIYDTANATIICVIAGHSHADAYTTSAKGYPIIVTTCDVFSGGGSGRTRGTTTEQAIDVFHIDTDPTARRIYATRIGFGEDREFSY